MVDLHPFRPRSGEKGLLANNQILDLSDVRREGRERLTTFPLPAYYFRIWKKSTSIISRRPPFCRRRGRRCFPILGSSSEIPKAVTDSGISEERRSKRRGGRSPI